MMSETIEQVRQTLLEWLNTQQILLYPQRLTQEFEFDAIVIEPLPVAFEVIVPDNLPTTPYQRYRRLVTQRVKLAQQFGPYLPLIACVPADTDTQSILFVDHVFAVDTLPDLSDFKNIIQLDEVTQEILRDGEPKDIEFTSPDDFLMLWEKSLNIQSLVDVDDDDDTKGTLADYILQKMDADAEDRDLLSEIATFGDDQSNLSPERHKKIRQEFHDAIDFHIDAYLREQLHAVSHDIEIPLDTNRDGQEIEIPKFSVQIWELPSGSKFIVRQLEAERMETLMKSFDYDVDAWIIRALSPENIDHLILLLGSDLVNDQATNAIDAMIVNRFETSGWRVFPWDFAEKIPAFIQFLNEELSDD